jgi:hypothetical protein
MRYRFLRSFHAFDHSHPCGPGLERFTLQNEIKEYQGQKLSPFNAGL